MHASETDSMILSADEEDRARRQADADADAAGWHRDEVHPGWVDISTHDARCRFRSPSGDAFEYDAARDLLTIGGVEVSPGFLATLFGGLGPEWTGPLYLSRDGASVAVWQPE